MLGLPDRVRACLFDLDGVLTQTAKVHAAAWKQAFDGYLRERAARGDGEFVAFDAVGDYDEYVDGKPRSDGVRSFLQRARIDLAEGDPGDPAEAETIAGLGNRKNEIVLALIRDRGVDAYPGSLRYVKAARVAGLATAVVSSSANCRAVLIAAGIEDMFAVRIDGVVAKREHLAESRHRTCSSPARGHSASRQIWLRCSRTRWSASRPVEPAGLPMSSASIALARPTRCASTAPTSSSPTSPS